MLAFIRANYKGLMLEMSALQLFMVASFFTYSQSLIHHFMCLFGTKHNDKLPGYLLAQLVEHCTSIATFSIYPDANLAKSCFLCF